MKTTAEKICSKREKWFGNPTLTNEQLEMLSKKWHKLINRYNQIVLRAQIEN